MSDLSGKSAFQRALETPLKAYEHLSEDSSEDLDVLKVKVLIDYKKGRLRQATARYEALLTHCGLSPRIALFEQKDKLTPSTAPFVIFELLFLMTGAEDAPRRPLDRYMDLIDCFDPDDRLYVGALYNTLLPIAMRNADFAAAEQVASLALTEFKAAKCDYLVAFIHLHRAIIQVARGDLATAPAHLERARSTFMLVPEAECELAMTDLTQAWVNFEKENRFPNHAWLLTQRDLLISGEFWAETFLILATLLFRTSVAKSDDMILETHSALETVLRARGLTSLLPAMQVLREEYFASVSTTPDAADCIALPEHQLIWLMPNPMTTRINWADAKSAGTLRFPRIRAAVQLMEGAQLLSGRQFDSASKCFWPALEDIETYGWAGLSHTARPEIDIFLAECKARGRFVERARHYRAALTSQTAAGALHPKPPADLTSTEFAVLTLLPDATSNKAMARDLNVTEATIKFHLTNLYRKMNVTKRREAVKEAIARGWVSAPGNQIGT